MKKSIAWSIVLILLIGFVPVSAADFAADRMMMPTASIVLADDWRVVSDKDNVGEEQVWYQQYPSAEPAVSLPFETGEDRSTTWFFRRFTPDLNLQEGQRVVASFGGCRYYAKIWLNGNYIGDHEGAYGEFSFDVTAFIREDQDNLLVIRLFSANDGSTVRGEDEQTLPQGPDNGQGMQQPVYLSVVPDIAIADLFVDTQYENGKVNVQVIVNNPASETVAVDIRARISPAEQAAILATVGATFNAVPGLSKHTVTMELKDFHAWSVADPYRYTVWVDCLAEKTNVIDSSAAQVGFKDFRIDSQGYFLLNSQRIYVKSVNLAVDANTTEQALQAKLMEYKSCGFNMVRFVGRPAPASALNCCDRLGLLVYQETAMANKRDSEYGEDLIRRELRQLIERDRNHPSFAIVGILNEAMDTDTEYVNNYRAAVESLDVCRTYDNDLLVFLSSGRTDGKLATASASNPGSLSWDGYMGNEGVRGGVDSETEIGTGDIHGNLPAYEVEPLRAVFLSDLDVRELDGVRANSKVSGYSVSVSDGVALQGLNGLKDTCWCVELETDTLYHTEDLNVQVTLSDLGALEKKEYTARFVLEGEAGIVWEKTVAVTPAYSGTGRFVSAITVLDESIPLAKLPTGAYTFRAQLEGTDVIYDKPVYVVDAQARPALSGTVYMHGLYANALVLLQESGVEIKVLDVEKIVPNSTVVLSGKNMDSNMLTALYEAVAKQGVTVVVADVDVLGDWGYLQLPFEELGYTVALNQGELSAPILTQGLPKQTVSGPVCDAKLLRLPVAAQEILAGVDTDVAVGAYACGKGHIVVNTLALVENIGTPMADYVWLNMLNYAMQIQ